MNPDIILDYNYGTTSEDRDLPEEYLNTEEREISVRSLPSSFELTLALAYDNLFLNNVCGGDHSKAKSRVKAVVALAQTYFLDSATLGTKITLNAKEIAHTNNALRLRVNSNTCNIQCTM